MPTIFTGINFGDFILNFDASLTQDVAGRLVAIEKLLPGDPDIVVQASGLRIIAKDEIRIGAGVTVHADGSSAVVDIGGLGAPAFTLGGGEDGADGGGIGDVDGNDCFGSISGFGGYGGSGGATGTRNGGDGGLANGPTETFGGDVQFTMGTTGYVLSGGSVWRADGGGGGGGGGGSTVSSVAGAGGGGAGTILLMAPIIRIEGTLRANGGNGTIAQLQAGGGGGGGGGCIILCYGQLIVGPSGAIEADGGNGGNGVGGGFGGNGGDPGRIYHFPMNLDFGSGHVATGNFGTPGTP